MRTPEQTETLQNILSNLATEVQQANRDRSRRIQLAAEADQLAETAGFLPNDCKDRV